MRDLTSRNDRARRWVREPDARRNPCPDTRCVNAPRDVRPRDGEDTRACASRPVRAVIRVENGCIRGAVAII